MLLVCFASLPFLYAGEVAPIDPLVLTSPRPYQVVQRQGFGAKKSRQHNVSAHSRGMAAVRIAFKLAPPAGSQLEYRAVPLKDAFGKGRPWSPISKLSPNRLEAIAEVPAGGWYRLDVRASIYGKVIALGAVEPFGVGEVFLIAGQSYADNCSDEQLRINDPQGRVSVYDPKTGDWRIAHDPQPTPSTCRAGSIWPVVGDQLVERLKVPLGFSNVAFSATSSSEWLPGKSNNKNLLLAGKALRRFRYVLWQQGESDVLGGTSTESYIKNLVAIRKESAKSWGFEPRWLLAKSTLHPTVYHNPAREQAIRSAIAQLGSKEGFAPGPDTDTLTGENRGGKKSQRHFSPLGQRRAGHMWAATIWETLTAEHF